MCDPLSVDVQFMKYWDGIRVFFAYEASILHPEQYVLICFYEHVSVWVVITNDLSILLFFEEKNRVYYFTYILFDPHV